MEIVCVALTGAALISCGILLYIIRKQGEILINQHERIEQLEYEMDNYILSTYPAVLSHLQERFVETEMYEQANNVSKVIDKIEFECPLYQVENQKQ